MPDPEESTGFPDLLNPPTAIQPTGDSLHPGRQHLHPRLDAELATARAELLRVDTKANTLLALAGVLLGVGGALAASVDRMPALVILLASTAALLLVIAVILLGAAVRPRLHGAHGFVRWAVRSSHDVLDDLDGTDELSPLATRADELVWTSRALLGKYRLIRRATTLIVAGIVLTPIAAGAGVVLAMAGAS